VTEAAGQDARRPLIGHERARTAADADAPWQPGNHTRDRFVGWLNSGRYLPSPECSRAKLTPARIGI
jgi:hypothetical protein